MKMRTFARGLALTAVVATSACGRGSDESVLASTYGGRTLAALELQPTSITALVNTQMKVRVEATWSDGTTEDVTLACYLDQSCFSSTNPRVAGFPPKRDTAHVGQLNVNSEGQTVLGATYGGIRAEEKTITVLENLPNVNFGFDGGGDDAARHDNDYNDFYFCGKVASGKIARLTGVQPTVWEDATLEARIGQQSSCVYQYQINAISAAGVRILAQGTTSAGEERDLELSLKFGERIRVDVMSRSAAGGNGPCNQTARNSFNQPQDFRLDGRICPAGD